MGKTIFFSDACCTWLKGTIINAAQTGLITVRNVFHGYGFFCGCHTPLVLLIDGKWSQLHGLCVVTSNRQASATVTNTGTTVAANFPVACVFQLNRVERIQQKLSIMAYIGTFRENVKHLKPVSHVRAVCYIYCCVSEKHYCCASVVSIHL